MARKSCSQSTNRAIGWGRVMGLSDRLSRCRDDIPVEPEIAADDEIETRASSVPRDRSAGRANSSLVHRLPPSSSTTSVHPGSRTRPGPALPRAAPGGGRRLGRRRWVSTPGLPPATAARPAADRSPPVRQTPPAPRRPNQSTRSLHLLGGFAALSIPRAVSSILGASPQRLSRA